jgi:translation elongation factor EF-Ts
MYFRNISSRFFHLTRQNLATDKSALATLRKNTGYTFANCKKALEANQNDLAKVS